jgi:hypothetical protein
MNRSNTYAIPTVYLDEVNYYFNTEDLITDASFSTWRMALLHPTTNLPIYDNIAVLIKDIITGAEFKWYFQWVVPDLVFGCYRPVIYDSANNSIKWACEDLFQLTNQTSQTAIVKYRNAVNIQGFNYEGLPTWYNQHRLWLIKRAPQRQKESIGYNITSGTFERVRTVVTKSYEFVTEFLDENASDAFDVATIHSDMRIDVGTGMQRYRLPEDSEFQQEWTENYNLADASVRLELMDFSSSNKTK